MDNVTGAEIADIQALIADTKSTQMEETWQIYLDDLEGVSNDEKQTYLNQIVALREEFLRTLLVVQDAHEREMVCAVFYILLKSQWMLLNLHSGYLIREGQLDLRVVCRSGMLSALLDRVEKTLTEEQLHRITQFISQPLAGEDDLFPLSELRFSSVLGEKVQKILQEIVWESGEEFNPKTVTSREGELARLLQEQQRELEKIYAEQEVMEQEFQKISQNQSVLLFSWLQSGAATEALARAEMAEKMNQLEAELTVLRKRDAYLRAKLGTSDPEAIVAKVEAASNSPSVYDQLRDVLGSLEKSIEFVN